MNIKKVLTENNNIVALIIEDEGTTYPIRLESLHHPDILDPLLESGWELVKLPYGLRKGNVKIEDIPRGIYSEEGISAEEEVEMAYMVSNLYDNTDLKSKMSTNSVEYLEFEPSLELIKTREELLGYLDRLNVKNSDSVESEIILPINAIAKQSALFTLDEYFASENTRYREKIESLRNLSIKQFTALNNRFVELGMSKDFTLENFVNFYFSWGIPGINMPIISKEHGVENVRIDTSGDILDEKYIPYYKKRILSYMDATGSVYRDPRYTNSGWTECLSEKAMSKRANELRDRGFNCIAPVKIEAKVSEPVTYLTGEEHEVIYDTDICVIKTRGGMTYEIPTISVHDASYKNIRSDHYSKIISGSQDFYDELYIEAMAQELLNKTKINISTTSYDALKTTGASDKSIARYIFKIEDIIENYYNVLKEEQSNGVDTLAEMETSKKSNLAADLQSKMLQQGVYSGMFSAKGVDYVQGILDKSDMHYELISRIWESFVDGELLVDHLQDGKLADIAANDKESYVEYFKIANRYLGVSLDEICKKVSDIDVSELSQSVSETVLEFEGNGLRVEIPVKIINNTENAYQLDITEYKNAQSQRAQYVYYVEGAIEELGGTYSDKRHVGLFGKCLKLYDSNVMRVLRPIISKLTIQFYDLVEGAGYVDYEKDLFTKSKNAVIYSWIFQIGLSGKYKIPPVLLSEDMEQVQEAPESLRSAVRASWRNFCDSTVKMMDLTINESGDFYSYCINAMITPYYVLPKEKFPEIKVYPFVPTWVNTLGASFDEKVKGWIKEGKMPMIFESDGTIQRGFSGDYPNCCAPAEVTTNLNVQVEGLARYWSDGLKYLKETAVKYNLGNPPHPYEKCKPDFIWEPVEEPRKDGSDKPQMWRVDRVYTTDRELFIAKNPEFSMVYNPDRKIALSSVGFFRFRGYEAEDFLALSDLGDLGLLEPLEGKQAITSIIDNLTVKFGDTVAKYTDIEDLYETGEYKIKRITGRKFICEDARGLLIGVVI